MIKKIVIFASFLTFLLSASGPADPVTISIPIAVEYPDDKDFASWDPRCENELIFCGLDGNANLIGIPNYGRLPRFI